MDYGTLRMAQEEQPDKGRLQIQIISERQEIPVKGAVVEVSYTGLPEDTLEEVTTDGNGRTDTLELGTPPVEYSLDPASETQPYAEYTLRVSAAGF